MDAVARTLDFIAWSNFTDLRVLAVWLAGLAGIVLVIHLAWYSASPILRRVSFPSAAEALVVHGAAGLSLWSFALFALASLGLYRPAPVIAVALGAVIAAGVLHGPTGLLAPGRALARTVRDEPWIWLAFALCSIASLLPPFRWDEISYHLAYAEQWVRAGRLTVDPYMRYPLYANAWLLLDGLALMAGSEAMVHLLTWLTAVLAALAIGAFLTRLGVGEGLRNVAILAFFFTPLVQRYLNVGLIDVPLMAFFAIAVFTIFLARQEAAQAGPLALAAGVIAGLFVGMKGLALVYVPLFAGLALWRLSRQHCLRYLVAFAVCGSPWFVRNLILSGDPAPPLVSHVLGREALYWSTEDIRAQEGDVRAGLEWTPRAILSLPVRVLLATEVSVLRDWPLLGYALLFPWSILLLFVRGRDRMFEPIIAAWYSAVLWLATSYYVRYATFAALAVVCATVTLARVFAWLGFERRRWAVAIAAILLIGPTPAALQYVKHTFSQRVPLGTEERWTYVKRRLPEAAVLDSLQRIVSPPSRIYTVGFTHLKYYFQQRGYRLIGDVFHHGRYADFARALHDGRADTFVRSLPADVVAVDREYAAKTLGIPPAALVPRLAALPSLQTVHADSLSAIFRVAPANVMRRDR